MKILQSSPFKKIIKNYFKTSINNTHKFNHKDTTYNNNTIHFSFHSSLV